MILNGNKNSDYSTQTEPETPDTIPIYNEKTFNRLRDLQTLIKKESALKELCKKSYIKYNFGII